MISKIVKLSMSTSFVFPTAVQFLQRSYHSTRTPLSQIGKRLRHVQGASTTSIRSSIKPLSSSLASTPRSTSPSESTDYETASSIYVHLPFCAQRCGYCSFTVFVTGPPSFPTPSSAGDDDNNLGSHMHPTHVKYIDNLCREIESFFILNPHDDTTSIRTLYFGGGTPSLIHPTLLKQVIQTLKRHVKFERDIEITLEMDPATFTLDTAEEFVSLGVNRASVGAQTFDDDILRLCNRLHKSKDIYTGIEHIRKAGINNVSIDLISGLPCDTLEGWRYSINEVINLNPQHISIYDLSIEQGTKFFGKYELGSSPLPDESSSYDMLSYACEKLQNHSHPEGDADNNSNFERYEISNFAKQGHQSKHNIAYWKNLPFYAFGVGATSLIDDYRFIRPKSMSAYFEYVSQLEYGADMMKNMNMNTTHSKDDRLKQILFPSTKQMSRTERFEDFVINSMRLMKQGVDMKVVRSLFGMELVNKLEGALKKYEHFVSEDLMAVQYEEDGSIVRFHLTEKGSFIENSIVSDILLEAVWKDSELR